MTDGRTISVVMCTYNGAKFVAEQIESIICLLYTSPSPRDVV